MLELEMWKKKISSLNIDIVDKPEIIPPGNIKCKENKAFKCNVGYHTGTKCSYCSGKWITIQNGLTHHSHHLKQKKESVQKLLDDTNWQIFLIYIILYLNDYENKNFFLNLYFDFAIYHAALDPF